MIEFKGAFYRSKTSPSQSVLVQFDGVMLHIWNISSPFHRILSCDLFKLPFAPGQNRRYVKLPNGCRIESDDKEALDLLKSRCRANLAVGIRPSSIQRPAAVVISTLVVILTLGLLTFCFIVV